MRFEWKVRGESGFNRTVHQIISNYYFDLGCDVGDESYWKTEIQDDATALMPTSKSPITNIVLAFVNAMVVGFALIRAGKMCLTPQDQEDERARCSAGNPSWYIEFICSQKGQGYGRQLMDEIHRTAIERNVHYMALSALPTVIMFYHTLGYKLTLNLDCVEKPRITELAQQIRADIKRRKEQGVPLLGSVDDMLADPTFSELLVHAVREKLSTVRNRSEPCSDTKACVQDGVYMIMCLPKKQMELTSFKEYFNAAPVPETTAMDEVDPNSFSEWLKTL